MVYLCHAKTVTSALLQVAIVDDVTFIIVQTSQKLSYNHRRSYHSRKLDVRKSSSYLIVFRIDAFISTFVTSHKFTVKHSVHLYIIVSLYNISHSFEHYTSSVFQKLSRFDVIGVNYRTGQYTIMERGIDLSPNESLRVTAATVNTRIITSKMYETSL